MIIDLPKAVMDGNKVSGIMHPVIRTVISVIKEMITETIINI